MHSLRRSGTALVRGHGLPLAGWGLQQGEALKAAAAQLHCSLRHINYVCTCKLSHTLSGACRTLFSSVHAAKRARAAKCNITNSRGDRRPELLQ